MKKMIQRIREGVMEPFVIRSKECGRRSVWASGMRPEDKENMPESTEAETKGDTSEPTEPGTKGNTLEPTEAGTERDMPECSGTGFGKDMPECSKSERDAPELFPVGFEEDTLDPMDTGLEENTPEPADTGLEETNLHLQAVAVNHKGYVRRNNEDNFCLNGAYMKREEMDDGAFLEADSQESVQLYAVCDGMGGAECGEEASHLAVKELAAGKQLLSPMADKDELASLLRRISGEIYGTARQRGVKKSGTTIAMLLVNHGRVLFANVGDSRSYRFREGRLSQVSVDHSKVQRMISMGILTSEQARTDPDRHIITQYLGMPPEIKVSPYFAADRRLREGDICLLCSDGLTDMVEESRMEKILQKNEDLREAAGTLLKEALKNGGRDNITILLVRVLCKMQFDHSG
ncbi:MAG: protein phosphatase 2C domain-containing protein [Lachnospiraceae bacterium]|nr:protein phosphatase 2C domain-containing protein [Lachnospiraceae bacterium]